MFARVFVCTMHTLYLYCTLGCNDPIHRGFRKWIELLVLSPHKVWLEEVTTVAVVLELALVQLHWQVRRLEVKRYQLAARVPEYLPEQGQRVNIRSCRYQENRALHLRHEVGRVHPGSLGVNSAQLSLVVIDKLNSL